MGLLKQFLEKKIAISALQKSMFVFVLLVFASMSFVSFADNGNGASQKNIFEDRDQDGLTNNEERLYGTDPDIADTDKDGYSDGAEIKSGYDPLKPAPGDRIGGVNEKSEVVFAPDAADNTGEIERRPNLTQDVAERVNEAFRKSSAENKPVQLDELKASMQEAMNAHVTVEELPVIDMGKIHVKKQKYSKLSEEDRAAKIKEDTLEYISAVSYILINNSPMTLNSNTGASLEETISSFMNNNAESIVAGDNPEFLQSISEKSRLVVGQLYAMEVPKDMVETHVKAIQLVQYAQTLHDSVLSVDSGDPLARIQSTAKVESYMALLSSFGMELQNILIKNDLDVSGISNFLGAKSDNK